MAMAVARSCSYRHQQGTAREKNQVFFLQSGAQHSPQIPLRDLKVKLRFHVGLQFYGDVSKKRLTGNNTLEQCTCPFHYKLTVLYQVLNKQVPVPVPVPVPVVQVPVQLSTST